MAGSNPRLITDVAAAVPPVGSWRRAVALVAVLSLLAGLVLAVRGERAGALSPSSFDATDGVLDASATLLHALDQASGPSDDIYSGGGPKEDDLCPSVDPDHAAPPKADLTDFWLGVDRAGGEDFLYLAWQRQTTTGTATIDFELNQLATGCGNGANPVRAAGDLLFTYDFQGGNTIGIEVRSWNGTVWGAPMVLDSSTSEASISAGENFGELAINLHDAGIFVPGVCTSFASAFAKSRTGSGGAFSTSTIKDFISPIPAVVSNCALVVIDKRDDAGGPLAGAVFTLFTDNNGAPGTSTGKSCTTGASGACTIDDIFYGTYWLVETTTPAGHDTAPPQQVVVGPNGTTPPSPIPFVNPRQPGSVSIQKTDDAGAALAGATFTLYTDASNAPGTSTGQSCTTGAAGGCTITGVAAGTYWVVETTTPAGHTTVAPVKAQVGAGQAVNLALVDPRIPGQVNIHKTDDAGAALAGAVFTLYTDDANAPGTSTAKSCTTGASGDCSIGGILPGTYWVVETTTPAGHTTAAPQKVTVGLASTVDLTFVNPRIPSTIDIRKTDDAGANLAGAGFTLHTDLAGAPGASTGQSCTTGATGTCTIDGILPGTYWVVETTTPAGHDTAPAQKVTVGLAQTVNLTFVNPAKPSSISLDKLVDGADHASAADALVVRSGTPLTYTVVIANTGQLPLTITALLDTLKADFAATCPQGTGSVLAVAARITCTYPSTATTDANNVASVQAVDLLNRPRSASDSTFVDVINPAIAIVKAADPTTVNPGQTVTYAYKVTNPGDSPLSNVTVVDDRCSPLAFTGGDTDGDSRLDVGETWSYSCSQAFAAPGSVTNVAVATGTPPVGPNVTADSSQTVQVVAPPSSITLDKKVNGADHASAGDALVVRQGDPLTYTVVITNTGQLPLTITALLDTLKANFAATCPQGAGSVLAVGAGITCTYQSTAGSVDVTNVATVNATDSLDRPRSATDATFVNVVNPAIQIGKSANPPTVSPGETVTYTYAVTNPGDVALSDVVASDNMCSPLVFVGGDTDADGQLDLDETWVYTCSQVLADPGAVTNVGVATGKPPVGPSVNSQAEQTVQVIPPVAPAVEVLGVELARTGADALRLALFGLTATALGLALVAGSRRRREQG